MIRQIHSGLATLALILGILHLSLVIPIYGSISLDALWFAGSGLAVIAVALMNLMARSNEASDRGIILALGNAMMTGFFGLAWTVLKEPQVVIGFVVFLALTGLTLFFRRKEDREAKPLSTRAIILIGLSLVAGFALLMVVSRPG